jgi:hypothetical protein
VSHAASLCGEPGGRPTRAALPSPLTNTHRLPYAPLCQVPSTAERRVSIPVSKDPPPGPHRLAGAAPEKLLTPFKVQLIFCIVARRSRRLRVAPEFPFVTVIVMTSPIPMFAIVLVVKIVSCIGVAAAITWPSVSLSMA